jgi:phage tail-like protein
MPEAGTRTDPYRNYNFKIEIQGVTEGHFAQCTNIGIRVQAISYREGGAGQVTHRIPGPVDYADITLCYGLTASTELWMWFMSAVKGTVERKNVSIVLLASDGVTEATRWNLVNAWPTSWSGVPLDARGAEVALERLTLAFETLERG